MQAKTSLIKVSSVMVCITALLASAANAVAHFAGRSIRERDGNEVAELVRLQSVGIVRIKVLKEPLGKDERLAAASPGRKRNRDIARLDRFGLLVGPGAGGFGHGEHHDCVSRTTGQGFSSERTWCTRQIFENWQ